VRGRAGVGLGEYSTEGGRWSGCARDRASHLAALCLVARRFQSRSTAKLTNGGARVGRSIAARRGCPRIRFELVLLPCAADGLPPRINESAERPAPRVPSPIPRTSRCGQLFSLFWLASSESRPAEAFVRRATIALGKLVLVGGSPRAASTSRDQRDCRGCMYG
jgi:hypothetical protein